MKKAAVFALLALAGVAFATGLPTTLTSAPPVVNGLGQAGEPSAALDRQADPPRGGKDAVSNDSLYWKDYYSTSYLKSSAKVQFPSPANRTAMSFQYSQTVTGMDPAGDYVYEVYSSTMRKFNTITGAYTSYNLTYSGNGPCGTDGQYVYVPRSGSASNIDKYTTTGTYVNTTTVNYTPTAYGFGVANDTVWLTNTFSGTATFYGYACSRFTGGSISHNTTWAMPNVGGSTPMNVAWDGQYYYYVSGGYTSNPYARFYANRTLRDTGRVYCDGRGVMASALPAVPGDVGTLRVIGPSGNVPYGVPVIPQAKVKNYSTVTQTFPVRFDIGTVYNSTKVVRDLAAGDSATVSFDTWPANVGGAHAIKCSTRLSSDTVRSNDKATGACFVPLVDAGVRAILAPTGTIPYGTPVQPQARVKNFGTAVIPSFSVKFTIGGFYRDSVT
ncbi:hypothetical protein FJY70_02355, partial [candidate division WOR-3 bacterium]|nr:hypothetical protein [candidate division WOR-3 bacterium]